MTDLRVCHLYPEHLNIYADRGNIAVLRARCRWRGIGFAAIACGPGDPLPDADLYYVGGGQDRDQLLIEDDLVGRAANLRAAVDDGAWMLAVCGGYQMLGHYYRGHQGDEMRGTGLVDLVTEAGPTRMIGNISIDCELRPGQPLTVVGFENHAGRTRLGEGVRPLGRVLHGHGNNGRDGGEGVHAGRIVGTYIHGPLLPKNPALADLLIAEALGRRHGTVALEPLDDRLEGMAHDAALAIAAG
jgi:lipid II isoglutaminyl synthase (glutamine-hydrolysing)